MKKIFKLFLIIYQNTENIFKKILFKNKKIIKLNLYNLLQKKKFLLVKYQKIKKLIIMIILIIL